VRKKLTYILYSLLLILCFFVGFIAQPSVRLAVPTSAADISSVDSESKFHSMLDASVRVRTLTGSGSGVILFSDYYGGDDSVYSYILTNQHVVRNYSTVSIEKFNYFGHRTVNSIESYEGKVIAKSSVYDLAVVEIKSSEELPTAKWLPKVEYDKVLLSHPMHISACPLVNDPLVTSGRIASLKDRTIKVTAFAVFGSSGGAAYTKDTKFLGLVKGIAKYVRSNISHAVPGIVDVIPVNVIAAWLKSRRLDFIFTKDVDKFNRLITSHRKSF
jgi:hypothetical protein